MAYCPNDFTSSWEVDSKVQTNNGSLVKLVLDPTFQVECVGKI